MCRQKTDNLGRARPASNRHELSMAGRRVIADPLELYENVSRAEDRSAAPHGVAILAAGLSL